MKTQFLCSSPKPLRIPFLGDVDIRWWCNHYVKHTIDHSQGRLEHYYKNNQRRKLGNIHLDAFQNRGIRCRSTKYLACSDQLDLLNVGGNTSRRQHLVDEYLLRVLSKLLVEECLHSNPIQLNSKHRT